MPPPYTQKYKNYFDLISDSDNDSFTMEVDDHTIPFFASWFTDSGITPLSEELLVLLKKRKSRQRRMAN